MKKLHLILLSLVAAIPGGYLCYLLGAVLAMPRTDLWKKPLLGGTVVLTGLLVLLLAVVWPLLYAIAFYDDPNKGRKDEEEGEGEASEEAVAAESGEVAEAKAPRGESFEEEDIDVFEREGESGEVEEADDFEEASEGSEFDLEEESIEQAETAEFALDDADFEDLELEEEEEEEEEEEAPKKKSKKKKK